MVLFKCKRSGNIMAVFVQSDIDVMRKHESYTEVSNVEAKETIEAETGQEAHADETVLIKKRRGRPKQPVVV